MTACKILSRLLSNLPPNVYTVQPQVILLINTGLVLTEIIYGFYSQGEMQVIPSSKTVYVGNHVM